MDTRERLRHLSVALVPIVWGVLCPQLATAHGVVVPDQFRTIQEAVDAPHSGSIAVREGIYAPFEVVGQVGRLSIFGVGGDKVTIDGGGDSTPVSVRNSQGVFIWGFTFRDSDRALVEIIDSRDVGLAQSKLKRAGGAGVSVVGSRDVQVLELRVSDSEGPCIEFIRNEDGRASNQARVHDNKLAGCGGDGIIVSGNDAKVEKNLIRSVGGAGIVMESGVGHRVKNNRIRGPDDVGILVATDRVVVKDNRVRRALSDSFRVEGVDVRLKNNEVRDPSGCGLHDLAAEGINDYRKNEFVTTCFGELP